MEINMSEDNNELTKEDIMDIIRLLKEANEKAGRKIEFATLHQGDDIEILVDNRDKEKIH